MSNFSPSPSSTVQRPDISMALMEHDLDAMREGMIAMQVLPVVEVDQFQGNYGKFERSEIAQDPTSAGADYIKRAAGGEYKSFDYKVTTASYETEEYGEKFVLDQRFMRSYAYIAGGDMDNFRMIAAAMAQEGLLIAYEKRVAAAVFNATTFTSNTTAVSTEWSTVGSSTPIADVRAAKLSMRAKFGAVPKSELRLIMSSEVRDYLRATTDINAKFQYVKPVDQGSMSDAMIADALGVGGLIVGDSMRPTHAQGGTAAFADIWDDEYVMLAKISPSGVSGLVKPGLGRTFHWRADGSQPLGLVETYFDIEKRSEVVRIRHQTDEIIEIVDAGWLLSNITA